MDSDLTYYRRRAGQEAAAAAAADEGTARQIHLELARCYNERCIAIENRRRPEVSNLPPAA